MNLNKNATSIVEAMIVMLIVVSWIVWMYKIYDESINLSTSINNKIQAIQIAKQWMEVVTNIRDTNWIVFSSDHDNCWNTLNYNSDCIWDSANANNTDIVDNWSYIIYQSTNKRWIMEEKLPLSENYSSLDYRNKFKVWLEDWIYTQSWWITTLPLFTRELKYSYISPTHITITSLVQWSDSSSSKAHSIELEQTLTNWKK